MDGFVKVGEKEDVPPGGMLVVPGVDRVDVCVVNLDGIFHAFSGVCTHKGGPLYRGALRDGYATCPWHGAKFNVRTGRDSWPADRPLRTFEVRVEGSSLYLKTQPVERTTAT